VHQRDDRDDREHDLREARQVDRHLHRLRRRSPGRVVVPFALPTLATRLP
jgi:hypothetical protein